jgi:hypothetical protein
MTEEMAKHRSPVATDQTFLCMRIPTLLVAVLAVACTSTSDRAAPRREITVPDSEIIRTAGVPTDPDDTLAAQYGKHIAPRMVPVPGCLPGGIAQCILDTATDVFSVSCCIADQRQAKWLVFAAAGDSSQLFMVPGTFIDMNPPSAGTYVSETVGRVDRPWIRARFPHTGTYVFTLEQEADDTVIYQLRVVPVVATGASRPIGKSATVTITGKRTAKVAIAPASMAGALEGPALRAFAVDPGTYRVLLVRDTSYIACTLPCSERRRFALRAEASIRF